MARMLNAFRGNSLRQCVAYLLLGTTALTSMGGCSRQFWRQQADHDAYEAASEKLNNPHWQVPRLDLTPDRRSRFYDPYDPDCGPLPPDDPSAHEIMHFVSGRKGYKNWHKFGTALSIENPQWLEPFGVSVENADPVIGHSAVSLPEVSLPQSVELAYIHNRDYQTQIEDLFLSALTLTLERFKLGVRYLGVSGREPGSTLTTNTNAEGTTRGALNSNFGLSQALPTGGQIAVELANSTLWLFGSPNSSSATSLAYSFTQPLLFNAGRKIALEPLTQAERSVLYSARNLARFRLTLFVDVATLYLRLLLQRQNILNAQNNIRQLEIQLATGEALDAYVPNVIKVPLAALPGDVVIPESLAERLVFEPTGVLEWYGPMSDEDEQLIGSLSENAQYQAVVQDIITFARNITSTLPTEQFRTRLNTARSSLANSRRLLADSLDTFKIRLGLPPDVDLDIELSLLGPFELIGSELILNEAEFRDVQERYGARLLPQDAGQNGVSSLDLKTLQQYLKELGILKDRLYTVGMVATQSDFGDLRYILELTENDWQASEPGVRFFNSQEERDAVVASVAQDLRLYRMSERDFALAASPLDILAELIDGSDEQAVRDRLDSNGNGTIETDELPKEFIALPSVQASIEADAETGNADAASQFTYEQLLKRTYAAATTLREDLQRVAQSLQVVQAGVRVETIPINRFSLDGALLAPDIDEVVRLGLENRRDLMNARAAVMDARRRVEIAANRLEAALDVEFSGSQGLSAGGPNNSNYGAALRFTAPLDMVTERNVYRRALVTYQRQRRSYMLAEDQVKQAIRTAWRQIMVQQERLNIDRETVRNAARQYDSASLDALQNQNSNANGLNVLTALNTVLTAQNALAADWVTYEVNRLNIFRDMGIMQIDQQGIWSDGFYLGMEAVAQGEQLEALPEAPAPVPETSDPAVETP
jgi:outer membrane protein TolC